MRRVATPTRFADRADRGAPVCLASRSLGRDTPSGRRVGHERRGAHQQRQVAGNDADQQVRAAIRESPPRMKSPHFCSAADGQTAQSQQARMATSYRRIRTSENRSRAPMSPRLPAAPEASESCGGGHGQLGAEPRQRSRGHRANEAVPQPAMGPGSFGSLHERAQGPPPPGWRAAEGCAASRCRPITVQAPRRAPGTRTPCRR